MEISAECTVSPHNPNTHYLYFLSLWILELVLLFTSVILFHHFNSICLNYFSIKVSFSISEGPLYSMRLHANPWKQLHYMPYYSISLILCIMLISVGRGPFPSQHLTRMSEWTIFQKLPRISVVQNTVALFPHVWYMYTCTVIQWRNFVSRRITIIICQRSEI